MPNDNARPGRRGLLCLLLGCALMLWGGFLLLTTPDLLEYVLPAPDADGAGGALRALCEQGGEQMAALSGVVDGYAFAARAQGVSVTSPLGSVTATVYAVSEGYFDVVHETLQSGRFITQTDVRRAERAVVLDSRAALALFSGEEPVGREVTLGGKSYEVAGVFAGGRRIGETDAYIAYVPVTAADADGLSAVTAAWVARPVDDIGSAIQMENTLRAWKGGGSFYSLSKLRLGATAPLRWALLIAGLALLLALLRRVNALAWGRICLYADRLRLCYARELLPGMIASALLCLLLYAALACELWALAAFSIAPLLVFSEWIPEVVVELSSLQSRFWALAVDNAAAVRYVTRFVCRLELGQGLLRWGFFAALLGLVLRLWPFLSRRPVLAVFPRER